jgi:arylsulfatase A-like enzyme
LAPALFAAEAPARRADHVVLVSFDGLRVDALSPELTPNILALAARGASCPVAETIRPSITLPSHVAMLTGLDYARHGVTWNDYRPGVTGHPTVFSVAHAAGLSTAMLYGKSKFEYLAIPGTVDWMHGEPPPMSFPLVGRTIFPTWGLGALALLHLLGAAWAVLLLRAARSCEPGAGNPPPDGRRTPLVVALVLAGQLLYAAALYRLRDVPVFHGSMVKSEWVRRPHKDEKVYRDEAAAPAAAEGLAKAFVREWPSRRFALTVVHFRDPDEAGHREGWMGPRYRKAVARCDRALGLIIDTVRLAGLEDRTAILVTADHGGSGRRHYAKTAPDMPEHVRIPWICAGPGVPKGLVIHRVVRVFDTMPTLLALLGVPIPEGLDGRPVTEIVP